MKALSIMPDYAIRVFFGIKTIECRTWKTDYRGDLLICASSREFVGAIARHALCIVTLSDIEKFKTSHLKAACMTRDEMPDESYAWHFENLRWVKPFEVKGKLHLYEVDDKLIKEIPKTEVNLKKYYEPLVKWSDRNISEKIGHMLWNDLKANLYQN